MSSSSPEFDDQNPEGENKMFYLITGGSGSGKSAYAEQQVLQAGAGRRIYIATMIPYGEEGRARVKRHSTLRAGKRFETVECYTGLYQLAANSDTPESVSDKPLLPGMQCTGPAKNEDPDGIMVRHEEQEASAKVHLSQFQNMRSATSDAVRFYFRKSDIVLLECLSNLVANEMFEPDGAGENVVHAVLSGVDELRKHVHHLFIVTNEVFSDGFIYDRNTLRYMECLGTINCALAGCADCVAEVVYGIPVIVHNRCHLLSKSSFHAKY